MRIRDEYLHGSDLTGVVKKIEVTIGTGNNANQSVIKYTKADSTDSTVEVPIGDITGKAATASKLDNTSAIGSKTNPVYFTANGVPSACTYSLNATVPVGAANQVLYYSATNTLGTQSYATLTSKLDIFTVATASAAGKKGLVPAPAANQLGTKNFFLRADGVWTVIESKSAALNGTDTSLVTTGEKYNWNSAYNWYNSMTSGDTDGIINKWKEVEAFLANYGDSSTLAAELAKLVTLSTDQTITGVKTFSEVINGSITGNAGTADKLKNSVTINGVAFDGSADITITANPNSHSHGNITNEGAIGTAANKPIITTTNGVLTTGSFGTTANTFCEGNDSRLSDARKNPKALTLGVLNSSGAVVGTNTVYDGSSALSFKVKAGSGITLSQSTKGEVIITNASPDVNHNTDTKVKLTATDGTATDRYIPFPTTGTSISSGSAYELFYQSDFKYNPGTKLFSVPNIKVGEKITVTGTSALGTVTSGVWNGTPIENNYLAHKSVTINGAIVNLGESIIVTAVANGGNAGTVGGYSPSDFLLKNDYETFESIIVSALTDLDNRKIEASDIPTSLPANGGHASTASNVDWSGVTNKPTSFPANGGNADTVGGYFPSAFVLNTKYEEFKSVVATALTDLDNRKIEASDIPTSLPADGGNADYAGYSGYTQSLNSIILPSSITNATNTVWCKFATVTINKSAYCNASGYIFFSGGESEDYKGILEYHFRSGSIATELSIGQLHWLTKSHDSMSVIAVQPAANIYDFYINNCNAWNSPRIYHFSAYNDLFEWNVGSWATTKPTASVTSSDIGRVYYSTYAGNVDWSGVTNRPTNVSAFYNDKEYLTSHAYSYGSIDIYDVNGAKKTSNNTVSASINTETLRLQEGANISITAINSGTSGGDSIKIAVTDITSNIDRPGYGKLALWYNGASSESAILQSVTYNEKLTVKAGSGIDFSEIDSTANNDIWTISAIPYNCAITLNNNSAKSLIKDSWSADKDSVYLTSDGTSGGTSLAAGTYALWIEDRSTSSGTPNYYSGTFTCAGNATAGRLDEIALHSSMATNADTNAPTRIFVATQISGTSGKHVLRFCSLDSSATNHYLTVKVNRII